MKEIFFRCKLVVNGLPDSALRKFLVLIFASLELTRRALLKTWW